MSATRWRGRLARHAPLLGALLAAVMLAGYVRTGLLLDDSFLLARAGHPLGFEALDFALRTTDHRIHLWVHQDPVVFRFFRPLTMLSLWIERRIWGTSAWGYHLTNVLLHLANAGLLWRLAMRCGLRRGAALLGALAWASSLQAIPAAGWISGRTEVLWCSFALLATHALLRWREGGRAAWLAASVAAAALAACAKESGLVAPLLALLAARLAANAHPARALTPRRVALVMLPAVVVLGVRLATIGLSWPPEPYVDVPHSALDALWSAAKPGLYLSAGWLSLPLSHWGPLEWMHTHPWSLALVVPAGILATVALARAAGRAPLALWLGWFAIALLPVMPVRPTSLYLYVPMMGLAMLAAAALQRSRHPVFAAWLVVTAVAGAGAHLFTQRYIAGEWRTSRAQVEAIRRWVVERGATRLVTIDTPVWLYALPATIELEPPAARFDTWFVNFRPRLDALDGSSVRWRDPRRLEITAPPGGFLHSVFERFLAFGGAPPERPSAGAGPVEVAIEGPRANPRRLVVTFRDGATRDSALIVRFTREGVVRVEPAGATPAAVVRAAGGARAAPSSRGEAMAP